MTREINNGTATTPIQQTLNTMDTNSKTASGVVVNDSVMPPQTDKSSKQVYVQQNFDQLNVYLPPKSLPSTEQASQGQITEPVKVSVTVKQEGITYRVGKWGWNLIDSCTLIHLRSNQPLYRNYLGTIKSDLLLLYRGHESIDRMDWLGYQNLPIRKTLQAIDEPDVMAKRIESNFAKVRLVLLVMMIAFIGLLVGYLSDTYQLLFMEEFSYLALLNNVYLMATTILFAYFSYAYAYHAFALSHDKFMLKRDFHRALRSFRRDAWFPFFREY
ncbi:hypothetical protein VIBNISOn1_190042 [Vibrio nigripulchritudo SOn1]|uniref:Uncharacterized protein n=1 Tax=Vibrio nigripulchritudo SOn1 TaxID=1238450 RepID=A0AAV2VQW4_9VIBR|nr:hypothetical protein [Vibrio nigripulchritudo]CCO46823.1 hypothetical protein VIBNISOn1_190042 [Vibrio nigripulchritudo SOn1]